MRIKDLDHPLTFILATTMVVMAMSYFLGWGFTALGWSGPAQLAKGYVAQ